MLQLAGRAERRPTGVANGRDKDPTPTTQAQAQGASGSVLPLLLSRGRGSSSCCGLLLPIGHCFVLLPHSSLHQSQSVSCVLSTPSHDGPTRRSAHAAVRVPRSRQKEKAAAACVAVRAPATKPTTTPGQRRMHVAQGSSGAS
jgi:hypothetical protein